MVDSLVTVKDNVRSRDINERQNLLSTKLDEILEKGEYLDEIPQVFSEYDYNEREIDRFALGYLAGYAAKKAKPWTNKCSECFRSLVTSESTETSRLIELKTRGYLLTPSESLVTLLKSLEETIQKVASRQALCADYLFLVVQEMESERGLPSFVGCSETAHRRDLTKKVVRFYTITRMHFICRGVTERNAMLRKKHLKAARLT